VPPNPPPPLSNVSLFSNVSLALHRAGTSQRLGSAVTNRFGMADDLPVKLALVLMPFHASIIPLHQRFANFSAHRARQPRIREFLCRVDREAALASTAATGTFPR
jgi:hypothetical protein